MLFVSSVLLPFFAVFLVACRVHHVPVWGSDICLLVLWFRVRPVLTKTMENCRPWDQMIASVFASEALFRTKYYFAWMTAEGSSAAAGFGYRTPDEIPGADKDQKEGDW